MTASPAAMPGDGAADPREGTGGGIPDWLVRTGGLLLGLFLGTSLGFFLTVGVFVAQARRGIYVFSLDDVASVRWEGIPTLVGAIVGAWVGFRSVRELLRGTALAVVAALVAVPVGWFLGGWVWVGSSGPWAGAVLAAALGLAVGALVALWLARRSSAGASPSAVPG